MILCENCRKPIDQYDIKPVWYHVNTGREQCNHDDLYDIRVAKPYPFQYASAVKVKEFRDWTPEDWLEFWEGFMEGGQ